MRKQARYWATKPLLKLAIGTALEIKGSALLKPLAIKGKALKAEILARKGIAILLKVNNEAGAKLERARLEGKEAKELNKTALMLSANAELAKGVPLRREANGIRTIDKLLKEEATKLAELTAAPTVGIANDTRGAALDNKGNARAAEERAELAIGNVLELKVVAKMLDGKALLLEGIELEAKGKAKAKELLLKEADRTAAKLKGTPKLLKGKDELLLLKGREVNSEINAELCKGKELLKELVPRLDKDTALLLKGIAKLAELKPISPKLLLDRLLGIALLVKGKNESAEGIPDELNSDPLLVNGKAEDNEIKAALIKEIKLKLRLKTEVNKGTLLLLKGKPEKRSREKERLLLKAKAALGRPLLLKGIAKLLKGNELNKLLLAKLVKPADKALLLKARLLNGKARLPELKLLTAKGIELKGNKLKSDALKGNNTLPKNEDNADKALLTARLNGRLLSNKLLNTLKGKALKVELKLKVKGNVAKLLKIAELAKGKALKLGSSSRLLKGKAPLKLDIPKLIEEDAKG